MLNYYELLRRVDHSGNSGTGLVAHAFEIPDVGIVLVWDKANILGITSTVVYKTKEDLIKVHGHNGDSVLESKPLPEDIPDILTEIARSYDVLSSVLVRLRIEGNNTLRKIAKTLHDFYNGI